MRYFRFLQLGVINQGDWVIWNIFIHFLRERGGEVRVKAAAFTRYLSRLVGLSVRVFEMPK